MTLPRGPHGHRIRHGGSHAWVFSWLPSPPPRRRSPRPPTWDQVYGLLLGPMGFLALLAALRPVTSEQLVGIALAGAGLAGLAVSAVDDRRSDWRARMVWAIAAAVQGAVMLVGRPDSLPGQSAMVGALILQVTAALTILVKLRLSRILMRTVTALSAAAPSALLVLVFFSPPYQPRWIVAVLQALSLVAFGLSRVARRPRGLRLIMR